jgi:DNA-binding response OmpR family regulator
MAHILVIDDELDIHFVLKEFLTQEGHIVDTAVDGKIGLRLADQHDYDLIITDVVMPERDGLEVITEMHKKSPHTRLIVMTGGTAKVDKNLLIAMAQKMRAHKVIAKPLNLRELKAAVDDVLAS